MQIEKIELQVKATDDGNACFKDNCTARFRNGGPDRGYVIVGKTIDVAALDADVLAMLGQVAPDEAVVWVPDRIVEE
jgi:hypothetical protein